MHRSKDRYESRSKNRNEGRSFMNDNSNVDDVIFFPNPSANMIRTKIYFFRAYLMLEFIDIIVFCN